MRTLIFLILSAASTTAETNRFPSLRVGSSTYTNAEIRAVTATDLIISFDGGGAKVALTNLSPELQKRFGYDPAKAKASGAEVELKKEQYRAQQQVAGAQIQFQRAYQNALGHAADNYESKKKAELDRIKSAKTRAAQLRSRLSSINAQSDNAWSRYVYTPSDAVSLRTGHPVDDEPNRLATAKALDRQSWELVDAISAADDEISEIESEVKRNLAYLWRQYQKQVSEIHASFQGRRQ